MGKGSSAPPPPDPKETAGAQTGTNVSTAIANAQLGNVNQVTPYGSLTYDQTGTYQFTDPNSGNSYDVPTFTATQTTGPGGQQVVDNNIATQQSISRIGRDQANRIEQTLATPAGAAGLPQRRSIDSVAAPSYQRVGTGPSLGDNLGSAGQIQSSLGNAGQINPNIADAGSVGGQLGNAGDITRSYNSDFSADRQRVEDALMQRLNPSLERDRGALESRLASQGIRVGSEAYQDAMGDFGRQSNDARVSAILGAGQEQSRLAGLARDQASFGNNAQAQQFGQNLTSGTFANDAQAQRFGQNNAATQLANQAQAQQFGQNLAAGSFANDAQAQGFNQLQGLNAAQQQEYQNALSGAGFNNTTANTAFNADLTRYNAGNAERSSALNEQIALRNQPINEIAALLSGSQLQAPQFASTQMPQIPTVDYAGLVNTQYQGQLDAWKQQQENKNQMMGAIGGLGKAYIGTL